MYKNCNQCCHMFYKKQLKVFIVVLQLFTQKKKGRVLLTKNGTIEAEKGK